jgi:hypothetical protein
MQLVLIARDLWDPHDKSYAQFLLLSMHKNISFSVD